MNGMRKWVLWVVGLAVLALGTAANAAPNQKTFFLTMQPVSGVANQLLATWTDTATGNSYINSIKLTLGADVTAVDVSAIKTQNTVVSPTCNNTASNPCTTGKTITISNITGIGPGTSGSIKLTVPSVAAFACNASSPSWTGFAYTGNAFGGTSFVDKNTGQPFSLATYTLVCQLVFVTERQPANAAATTVESPHTITSVAGNDAGPPVQVQAIKGGVVDTSFNTQITLSQNPSVGTLNYGAPVNAVSGTATFTTLSLDTIGIYTLTAHDPSGVYLDATSKPFEIFGGLLNCEPTMPFTFGDDPNGDVTQEGYASGTRGFWNKDGVSCNPLLYTFTNTILTDNTVHLEWDTSTGQHPAFTYIMTWKNEDVDNATTVDPTTNTIKFGWPVPRRVFTAWTVDGSGNPNFVPAQACISPDLPEPYAQLASSIGTAVAGTSQNISVTLPPTVPSGFPIAQVPAATPFPMVMGTERMLVTLVNGTTWTVTRGDGGTTPAPHLANDYVMSTPLPLDSTGVQVPMCVQSHAWQAVGFDPIRKLAQIRYTTRVFDIGDGWVGLR